MLDGGVREWAGWMEEQEGITKTKRSAYDLKVQTHAGEIKEGRREEEPMKPIQKVQNIKSFSLHKIPVHIQEW